MSSRSKTSCRRGTIPVKSRNAVSGKKFTYCRTSHPVKPSKGWKKQMPHRGAERELLMKECGPKAFLMPKSLKFPVVKASRGKNPSSCTISPKGVLAAYRRAKQYGYPKIAKKAYDLAKKEGFKWTM